jgi:signal transduction histidine kinase
MPSAPAPRAGAPESLLQISDGELQRVLLDIHDGPVQYMFAALSQLDLLRRALAPCAACADGIPALERAERIRQLLESGLSEIRSFIGAFRTPDFEARDLAALLEGLALEHEAMSDTALTLDLAPDLPEVRLAQKIVLYRVLQEALSNAYRHGHAAAVRVRLESSRSEEGEPWLALTVADNGSGFDPATLQGPHHFGVAGMRERAEMVGGRFSLEGAPGQGVTVRVEVPVP